MATIAPEQRLRKAAMLAKPVYIDPAFDDPAAVVALTRKCAPYQLAAKLHKMAKLKDTPWFRTMWAYGEQLVEPDAAFIFHSERFIEAAKESFDATVIVPSALMNNVNGPMPAGVPHLDLPRFRGADKFPFDMLVAMNYSGLFHEWAVPLASTISWLYNGVGGDFDYWPDGPDEPKATVKAPIWNAAVVSDNEYMYHRIGAIGPEGERLEPGDIGRDAVLETAPDGGWTIADGETRRDYRADQIRISILWKAYAFEDRAALAKFRDERQHLSFDAAMRILDADLDDRGVGRLDLSADFLDPHNRGLISRTYRGAKVSTG